MFISKFCKLGVHTIKSASTGTAPTLTSRFSNFPKADNHHLIFLRQKLFSSTADEVGDEEKKKSRLGCQIIAKRNFAVDGLPFYNVPPKTATSDASSGHLDNSDSVMMNFISRGSDQSEANNEAPEGQQADIQARDFSPNECMYFRGTVEGSTGWVEVVLLVVSGASHNLISPTVVDYVDIRGVDKLNTLGLILADGKRARTSGNCPSIRVALDSTSFFIEAHVFPLSGVDIILGMPFLISLGEVRCNWATRTIKLIRDGKEICLQGVPHRWC